MSIKAMKQALEALEYSQRFVEASANAKMLNGWGEQLETAEEAITSLRQAIAEAETQVSYSGNGTAGRENMTAPTGFFFQMPKAEKQESAMVKHMMEWVAFLKATSDNGQHKQIPSNLSAGACWDLAVELEQFIYTHPQPKREWVGLTDDDEIPWDGVDAKSFARAIEAKLKKKNGFEGRA